MGHVLISPNLYAHPGVCAMPSRAVWSWVESICWLGRNGRQAHFPKRLAADEFHATPSVVAALTEHRFWLDNCDVFMVPQQVPSWGGQWVKVWKFPATGRQPIPATLRLAIYERDGHACLHCGSAENLTLDHIHPWSLGGADTFENLQTLCRSCNSRKGARV